MLDPVELFPEVPNIYSFPSVHADMIFDKARVSAYRKAINETINPGDVVADLGAGTGLLSFLCLQAGAARVHAIERSDVIDWAKELAEKNGFSDRIIFHHGDARTTDIGERVNVIVSELMGHVAFEEGMAETISVAKNKFLAAGGISIPTSVSLRAALVNESQLYGEYIDVWRDVEGIDYSALRRRALECAYVTSIPVDHVLSEDQVVLREDFSELPKDLDEVFTFSAWRAARTNGITLWFDAQLTGNVRLSSSPRTECHWQQCFIPFETPIDILRDDNINVRIQMAFRKSIDAPFRFTAKLV